ncbi:hypothetical protein KXD40_008962 [Peronospora effusa]|uniref:Guanylate-binding protein/Atlastin C-terminal domain-containing protein n=1 Tax=Peronospora effusa TaxID=542832 RepID=A0A3M6VJL8_9STRA|nr:hypothetical protein DD238_006087 [Peronospora effusa]UIZ22019.1 hypothetical protein KXD40_008962 [Peronospora effusa]
MFGKALNGAIFVNLAGSYVEELNSGKTTVISSAWGRVMQAQCHDALEIAVKCYKAELQAKVRRYVSAKKFEKDATFKVIGYEKEVKWWVQNSGQRPRKNLHVRQHENL